MVNLERMNLGDTKVVESEKINPMSKSKALLLESIEVSKRLPRTARTTRVEYF